MIKSINYSCGNDGLEAKSISFKLDIDKKEVFDVNLYTDTCDMIFGTMDGKNLKSVKIFSEKDIADFIDGIRLKIKTEHGIVVVFKF